MSKFSRRKVEFDALLKRDFFKWFHFGRFLAAKIEFSYGVVQTVNLLALRLQWFESTPTQTSPTAILQVFKPFGGQLGIPPPVSDTIPPSINPMNTEICRQVAQSIFVGTLHLAGAH
jgi:hypothetical protein